MSSELMRQALPKWMNLGDYLKRRRHVLSHPHELILARGPDIDARPLAFAVQSLVVTSVVISAMGWALASWMHLPPKPIDAAIAVNEELRKAQDGVRQIADDAATGRLSREAAIERQRYVIETYERAHGTMSLVDIRPTLIELKRQKRAEDTVTPLSAVLPPLVVVMAANSFAYLVRKRAALLPSLYLARSLYLYYVSARLFVPSAIYVCAAWGADILGRLMSGPDEIRFLPLYLVTQVYGLSAMVVLRNVAQELADIVGWPATMKPTGYKFFANRLVLAQAAAGVVLFLLAFAAGVAAYAVAEFRVVD